MEEETLETVEEMVTEGVSNIDTVVEEHSFEKMMEEIEDILRRYHTPWQDDETKQLWTATLITIIDASNEAIIFESLHE